MLFRKLWNKLIHQRGNGWKLFPVSKSLSVPKHIVQPPYARYATGFGLPMNYPNIYIHNADEIQAMRKVCHFASQIRSFAGSLCTVGRTTDEIDVLVHEKIINNNMYPSPLNYRGFPKSCCTSVNQVVLHGIPDARSLKDGDIISIDISIYAGEHHGDCCGTFFVGNPSKAMQHLERVTQECTNLAIENCGPGVEFKEIGNIIQLHADKHGYSLVKSFFGHGIGRDLHMAPWIKHFRNNDKGQMLPGMIFTIEPMLCEGSNSVFCMEDGWTIVTKDQRRAAQWEQTILITETGYSVLSSHEKEL